MTCRQTVVVRPFVVRSPSLCNASRHPAYPAQPPDLPCPASRPPRGHLGEWSHATLPPAQLPLESSAPPHARPLVQPSLFSHRRRRTLTIPRTDTQQDARSLHTHHIMFSSQFHLPSFLYLASHTHASLSPSLLLTSGRPSSVAAGAFAAERPSYPATFPPPSNHRHEVLALASS